jgi:hypothetical protein
VFLNTNLSDPLFFLVDTGSQISIVFEKRLDVEADIKPTNLKVQAVTGDPVKITGACDLILYDGNKEVGKGNFLLTSQNLDHFDGIIGNDWLKKHCATVDYGSNHIISNNVAIPFQRRIEKSVRAAGLRVCFSDKSPFIGGILGAGHDVPAGFHLVQSSTGKSKRDCEACDHQELSGSDSDDDESTPNPRQNGLARRGKSLPRSLAPVGRNMVATECCVNVATDYSMDNELSDEGTEGQPASCEGRNHQIPAEESAQPDYMTDAAASCQFSDQGTNCASNHVRSSPPLQFPLYSKRTIVLPKRSTGSIQVTYPKKKIGKGSGQLMLAEPNNNSDQNMLVGCALLTFDEASIMAIPYVNLTDKPVNVHRGDILAFATEVDPTGVFTGEELNQVLSVNALEVLEKKETLSPEKEAEREKKVHMMIEDAISKSECPDALIPQLRAILWKYPHVLAEGSDAVGLCDAYEPSIDLDTDRPIYTPQYPIPYKMRQVMYETVQQFLKDQIIQHSKSPYNSPTIIVKKKDGGSRMCVDFRRLNEHVITDRHPLPRIDQILEELGGAAFLTALDLLHGFYNLKINPADRYKTAFSTPDGHYEFIRLPMGLKNSPSIFQRLMNMVLQETLGKFAFIYVDDIVIYSKTAEDHLQHIDAILSKLDKHGLRVKFSKCQLFRHQIQYLGFLVSGSGLEVNPEKVRAVTDFPRPADVKGIQAFLGLVGYFRTFVTDFATKARPMYHLLKKDVDFKWTKFQEQAFHDLKISLVNAPVLAFPDFNREFILTTDASGYAIGAILTQECPEGKGEHLISCHSRTLKDAETRYSNFDREILAVYYGVEQNRSHLWGNKFIVRTDNNAIPYLNRSKTSDSARAIRWFMKLGEYDFDVVHRKGKSIAHADACSRYPAVNHTAVKFTAEEDNHLFPDDQREPDLQSRIHAMLLEKACIAYLSPALSAPDLVPVITNEYWAAETAKVEEKKRPTGENVSSQDGIIYVRDGTERKVWVPPTVRPKLIRLYHEPPNAGHRGVKATTAAIKNDVFWSSIERDVADFIKYCKTCQTSKNYGKQRQPLKTTPIPKRCFDEVSLDVVGPLPISSTGTKYILVIQDRLSRWIVFAPMNNTSAETTARTFLKEWVCVHGPPSKLITDRGTNFISAWFKGLSDFLGIEATKTVAYRPQANGQNERSHRELTTYLRMYLDESKRTRWDTFLQLFPLVPHLCQKHFHIRQCLSP